ncbi:LysR family transcriptional regulator [Thalassomonas sp. M1454]|uniref:LysR family transcriptional regulator n=1 Tax=Thalassomonas sp. M1454 TaxID=2594477 RepID=UPI00117F01FE|nr:LysR family transcriptional regulator [Thalassomonas sp. M1454]TRX56503.1 LysR family transcriptional regulator [Thalassomonas sp. M1454]
MRSVEQELSRIDLNLLVSLSVLIKEKNVSRAADKLFLSQPAMSRTLKKLRDLLDDPLFHRESAGLRPTVKAIEIEAKLDQLLFAVNDFINGEEFDPNTCNKTFNISLPSLMSQTLMFPIINDLAKLAPNVVIAQHPATSEPGKHLENGEFDFSIHVHKLPKSTFTSTFLGNAYPVIFARKDHPLTKLKKVTIEDCLQYKFVDIILDNHANLPFNNPAKKFIDDHGLELTIAMKSGQLGLLTEVIKHSDHLLISAHFLMNSVEQQNNFATVFAFDEKKYPVETYLVDHERTHTSQAHAWLKQVLINSLEKSIR